MGFVQEIGTDNSPRHFCSTFELTHPLQIALVEVLTLQLLRGKTTLFSLPDKRLA